MATDEFQNLVPSDVFNIQYDRRLLHSHAIELFLISYPEFDKQKLSEGDPLYVPKYRQYMQVINALYGYDQLANFDNMLPNMWQICANRQIVITFTVKKLMGRHVADRLGLLCGDVTNKTNAKPTLELNLKQEAQVNKQARLTYTFEELRKVRQQNSILSIKLLSSGWKVETDQIEDFNIPIQQIHPEGYEKWIKFGGRVLILVEIGFKVLPEHNNPKTINAKDFHVHTLKRMLRRRLSVIGNSVVRWNGHMTRSNTVTFRRPPIVPNSQEMFWRTSIPITWPLEEFKKWSEGEIADQPSVKKSTTRSVHYFDLQKCQPFGEDIEEMVCLCNEWCNWTAFFAQNPIYRFIIVQNSQLYFTSTCNVPEIYLFVCTFKCCAAQYSSRRNLLLPLLHSADIYRHKYFADFVITKNPDFLNSYVNLCHPKGNLLCGVTYNLLRYSLNIVNLSLEMDDKPSADVCVKTFLDFHLVLARLHHRCSCNHRYVEIDKKKNWMRELEEISQDEVPQFFSNGYKKVLAAQLGPDQPYPSSHHMFGSDIEYSDYVPKSENDLFIKYQRIGAIRWGKGCNRLNVRIELDNFTTALIWVYKFFLRTTAKLTMAHEWQSRQKIFDYCSDFDQDFRQQFNQLPADRKTNQFKVSEADLKQIRFPQELNTTLDVIYTLKLYSFGLVIQHYCISARDKNLKDIFNTGDISFSQFTDIFRFVVDYTILEQTFRGRNTGQFLFDVDSGGTQYVFTAFYEHFWGRAQHELQNLPQYLLYLRSAALQYSKLFVWLKENGNQRAKFKAIINEFQNQLEQNINKSNIIYNLYVLNTIEWLYKHGNDDINHITETEEIAKEQSDAEHGNRSRSRSSTSSSSASSGSSGSSSKTKSDSQSSDSDSDGSDSSSKETVTEDEHHYYDNAVETMDLIMFYSARAILFCVMTTVFDFFQRIFNVIETQSLNSQFMAFSMAKPGWVPLFETIQLVLHTLEVIRTMYIEYDDETGRLWDSVDTTGQLAKCIYKHYYCKLCQQWLEELVQVPKQLANVGNLNQQQAHVVGSFLELQFIFGFTFTAKFHRFRKIFNKLRRDILRFLNSPIAQNTPLMQRLVDCRAPAEHYLKDLDAVNEAEPSGCQIWTNHLKQTNAALFNLKANKMGIDLAQADTTN